MLQTASTLAAALEQKSELDRPEAEPADPLTDFGDPVGLPGEELEVAGDLLSSDAEAVEADPAPFESLFDEPGDEADPTQDAGSPVDTGSQRVGRWLP